MKQYTIREYMGFTRNGPPRAGMISLPEHAFDQLEQFDHPENTLSEEEIEARLRELHERVQMPSAEDSATTAVAQKIKLKNEKSIDDTKTSSIHSRKALKLLPLVAVLVLLIGTVSAQAFGEN